MQPPPPHEHLPQPGESFAGKYRIGRVLGQGGVGVVFEAYHQRLNQRVAIKILRAEARRSAEWLTRFDREARAAVKLRGPNVARVFDVDSTDDGTPFMVMELLDGWNLSEEIAARGTLPTHEAVGYVLEACCAMAEAHALGIVHRDLTPSNIFLANAGGRRIAKVVSFYLLRYRSGSVEDHDHEVEEARWMPLAQAVEELTYDGEREMVRRALSRLGPTG